MPITVKGEFIDPTTEKRLFDFISSQPWDTRDSGRAMQTYGFKYFKGESGEVELHKVENIPDQIISVLTKINELTDCSFNQMTVNKYEPGQGIAAHFDHVKRFGDVIVGLTLGSGCTIIFEKMKEKTPIYLDRRSLMIMSGEHRYEWKHRIAKVHSDIHEDNVIKRGTRISLTFRECY